jgi:hypothetical protein
MRDHALLYHMPVVVRTAPSRLRMLPRASGTGPRPGKIPAFGGVTLSRNRVTSPALQVSNARRKQDNCCLPLVAMSSPGRSGFSKAGALAKRRTSASKVVAACCPDEAASGTGRRPHFA